MSLQYISDSTGQTTGVYIPITEWNELRSKYNDIDDEVINIPEWHKEQVRNRMEEYKKNPGQGLDFEAAMGDIEKDL